MARYIAKRKLMFIRSSGSRDYVYIKEGDVVQGVEINAVKGFDGKMLRETQKRHLRRDRNERLFFFKAWGVVRYARASKDLVHTRKQVTIPVEDKNAGKDSK